MKLLGQELKLPRHVGLFGLGKQLFNSLSVGQKVMTVIVVEILSYSVITTIALFQIHMIGAEIKQMANLYIPLLSTTESIRQQVQGERLHFKDVVFFGDRVVYDKDSEETYIAARTNYLEASTQINDMIVSAEELLGGSGSGNSSGSDLVKEFAPRLLLKLNSIRDAHRLTTNRVGEIFRHVEDGSFLMGMELIDGVSASERVLLTELDRLESDLQELKTASVDYAGSVERTSSRMTIMASIMTVCIVILIFFLVIKRNISKPLHVLTDAINAFDPLVEQADTKEEAKLMSRGDELGMVGRSFRDLKNTLRNQGRALRAAKEAAERADLGKSRFLAAASHDLRQPLHAMQMYIAALRQNIRDRKTLSIVSDVQAVSLATGRLLNSLLDISQLEVGAIKPQMEDFPVQELFNRVSISYLPLAATKGLVLHVVPTRAVIHSDPTLMERIVGNFLSNAIRYTTKGKVLVGCKRRGDSICIQVWDTGPGIPGDQAAAIFDDFHQLHNEERDRGKGLGLGLAIVRRLAECLDHQIEYRSVIGKGSCFGVMAKSGTTQRAAIRLEEPADSFHDLAGVCVLLIEDDKTVSDATSLLLKSWKCKVWCARTADEALKIVESKSEMPSIVVADYRLPGKTDGVEAIQGIQVALQMAIPGIIITGESDLTAIREIERMGYLILRKPVRPAKLRRLIAHYVAKSTVAPQIELT